MLRIGYSTNKWTAAHKKAIADEIVNFAENCRCVQPVVQNFHFYHSKSNRSRPVNNGLYLGTLLEDTGLNEGIFAEVVEGKLVELLIIGN